MAKKFIQQKMLYAKYIKSRHENYPAANSMHVLFRRRVLKWYFIQKTAIFSVSRKPGPICSADAKKRKSEPRKIFMHSIYILINSRVRRQEGSFRKTHVCEFSFSMCTMEIGLQVSPFFRAEPNFFVSFGGCCVHVVFLNAKTMLPTTNENSFCSLCFSSIATRAHDSSETN